MPGVELVVVVVMVVGRGLFEDLFHHLVILLVLQDHLLVGGIIWRVLVVADAAPVGLVQERLGERIVLYLQRGHVLILVSCDGYKLGWGKIEGFDESRNWKTCLQSAFNLKMPMKIRRLARSHVDQISSKK